MYMYTADVTVCALSTFYLLICIHFTSVICHNNYSSSIFVRSKNINTSELLNINDYYSDLNKILHHYSKNSIVLPTTVLSTQTLVFNSRRRRDQRDTRQPIISLKPDETKTDLTFRENVYPDFSHLIYNANRAKYYPLTSSFIQSMLSSRMDSSRMDSSRMDSSRMDSSRMDSSRMDSSPTQQHTRNSKQNSVEISDSNFSDSSTYSKPVANSSKTYSPLMQVYSVRSPCSRSKLRWVRAEKNCSMFYICARRRTAAVLTCPGTEVWSNSVTNCVPARSLWDDCPGGGYDTPSNRDSKQLALTDGGVLPQTVATNQHPSPNPKNSELINAEHFDNNLNNKPLNQKIYYKQGNKRSASQKRHGNILIQRIRNSSKQKPAFQSTPRYALQRTTTSKHKNKQHTNSLQKPNFSGLKHSRPRAKWRNGNKAGFTESWKTSRPQLASQITTTTSSWKTSRPQLVTPITTTTSVLKTRRPPVAAPITTTTSSFTSTDMKRYQQKYGYTFHRFFNEQDTRSHADPPRNKKLRYKKNKSKRRVKQARNKVVKYPVSTRLQTTSSYDIPARKPEFSGSRWWGNPTTLSPVADKADHHRETTSETAITSTVVRENREDATTPIFVPECGVSMTSMIVGGLPARRGRWPWVVSLQLSWASNHVCGATLVHPRWVVTAAHCVSGSDFNSADEWKAVFSQHGSSQSVDHIVKHPEFKNSNNYPNDIALLRLAEATDVTGFDVRHACVPDSRSHEEEWPECWIMGWGETSDYQEMELKELAVNIRQNAECSARWGKKRILNSHVCVGNGDNGACNGDSGGPLICRRDGYHYLAGVTSWGVSGCQTTGYPSVFTRVAYYTDWIQSVIHAQHE